MTSIFRKLTCIIAFASALLMSIPAQSQIVERAGDTSVYLIAPDGYERKTTGGAHFFNMENKSSITVLEMPIEAYDALYLQHTNKKEAKRKVDDRRCKTNVSETTALQHTIPFMEIKCAFEPRQYTEYLMLLKGKNTVQVRFTSYDNVPSRDAVLQSAKSIVLKSDDVKKRSYFDNLEFTFDLKEPFVHMTAAFDTAVLTTTLTPGDYKKRPAIGISIRESLPVDYEGEEDPVIDAAINLLLENAELIGDNYDMDGVKYLEEDFVTIGGQQGYYIKASRKGKLAIQYVWPHSGHEYFKLQAVGTDKNLSPHQSVIKEIAKSVSPK